MHGLEPSDVALYSALPMPTGEAETFTAMRLTTNLVDGKKNLLQMKVTRSMLHEKCTR